MKLLLRGFQLGHQYRLLIITGLISFTLFSCSVEKKTKSEFEDKLATFTPKGNLDGLKAVVLLPGEGCSGCISDTERFVKTLSVEDGVKVIFTAVKSVKILRMKLQIDLEVDHFIVDRENVFNQGRTYSIYPTVFLVAEGKVVDYEYISPSGSFELQSLLAN